MRINVGTKNQNKVAAVQGVLMLYPDLFPAPEVVHIDLDSGTFHHPKNISETIRGAIDRAKRSFMDCDYSFGLEGGLIEVPLTRTGFMETGVCAVYDGKDMYLGLSPSFEWPKQVIELILTDQADASQAFKRLGFTEHEKLGAAPGGMVGFLTKGRLTREEQTKQSIITALIQLEQREIY